MEDSEQLLAADKLKFFRNGGQKKNQVVTTTLSTMVVNILSLKKKQNKIRQTVLNTK